jgi:hypothetical protein
MPGGRVGEPRAIRWAPDRAQQIVAEAAAAAAGAVRAQSTRLAASPACRSGARMLSRATHAPQETERVHQAYIPDAVSPKERFTLASVFTVGTEVRADMLLGVAAPAALRSRCLAARGARLGPRRSERNAF